MVYETSQIWRGLSGSYLCSAEEKRNGSIAGNSIGTFMKIKRMEAAAELLVSEPQLSICEVAETAGYENQSKFSAAFKSVMGVTPFAYRCKSW